MAVSGDAQKLFSSQHVVRIGDTAPDFTADSSHGQIHFYDYIDKHWAVLFSHPADFTPVCTTELGRAAHLKDEWEKRQCKVLALSVDTAESHKAWIGDIESTQNCKVWYPIIADPKREVAVLYGMLDQNYIYKDALPATVRSVYIIGPDKKVKLIITYPASTGRQFGEVLRVLDSLQLTAKHQCATPADWQKGGKVVILPTIKDDKAHELFPGGFETLKPYLRLVPDPSVPAAAHH